MSPWISSLVTPFCNARRICPRNSSVRYRAVKVATVIRLRSRFDNSGCSHTSPKSTSSRSRPNWGKCSYTDDRDSAIISPSDLSIPHSCLEGAHAPRAHMACVDIESLKWHHLHSLVTHAPWQMHYSMP